MTFNAFYCWYTHVLQHFEFSKQCLFGHVAIKLLGRNQRFPIHEALATENPRGQRNTTKHQHYSYKPLAKNGCREFPPLTREFPPLTREFPPLIFNEFAFFLKATCIQIIHEFYELFSGPDNS